MFDNLNQNEKNSIIVVLAIGSIAILGILTIGLIGMHATTLLAILAGM